jgi:hypothetical protein
VRNSSLRMARMLLYRWMYGRRTIKKINEMIGMAMQMKQTYSVAFAATNRIAKRIRIETNNQ